MSSGCETNICDSTDAVRPLHVAVGVYNDVVDFERILACLVDGGCDLDARALGCETSLYRALDLGKADLATLLLQYGADVEVECPHGVTILNKVTSHTDRSGVLIGDKAEIPKPTDTKLYETAFKLSVLLLDDLVTRPRRPVTTRTGS